MFKEKAISQKHGFLLLRAVDLNVTTWIGSVWLCIGTQHGFGWSGPLKHVYGSGVWFAFANPVYCTTCAFCHSHHLSVLDCTHVSSDAWPASQLLLITWLDIFTRGSVACGRITFGCMVLWASTDTPCRRKTEFSTKTEDLMTSDYVRDQALQ